jgi:hypothetical protein
MTDQTIHAGQLSAKRHLISEGYSIQEVEAIVPRGRTLRDDFAIAALPAIISSRGFDVEGPELIEAWVRAAFAVADSMLVKRP